MDIEFHNKLRHKYNPDGSELRNYQLRLLEMLKYVDNICKENQIKYWLSSGTCLGAVRHNGFIPWDDDVDIEMLPSDYKRFCKLFIEKYQDKDGYVLQSYETDREYVSPYGKIRYLNSYIKETNTNDLRYRYKGFYIDVFPIYESSSRFIAKLARYLQRTLLEKLSKINNDSIRRFQIKTNHFIVHRLIFPCLALMSKVNSKKKVRIGGLGSGFLEVYDMENITEVLDFSFEGCKFPIPKQYDKYLKCLYGDYMKIPNIEEIHPHIDLMRFN